MSTTPQNTAGAHLPQLSHVLTIARKELRATFQSPVAVLFLAGFQILMLATFFIVSGFFARNLADLRPLFAWMPLVLIGLVSAITMRAWAEEKKMGTLEVLLTLPLNTWDLVLGKFAAGVTMVAVALLLTFPLPITVSFLGPLDWGPVIGGYVAALLLGALYVALGLCVSARTDNQVVALMVTLMIGLLMYGVGAPWFTNLFDGTTREFLGALGTGSRFESIERGVLDIRDLAYYAGLTVLFLVVNWVFLERGRLDTGSPTGRNRNAALVTMTALVALNVTAAVIWLTPVNRLRIDLTGQYSIDAVTVQTLQQLDEPLTIHGYFSDRTHPLLAPLVPQIKDLVKEYEIYGGGNVEIAFLDPNQDEELEAEINEQYGIKSVPFRIADRHEQSVVNAYFHLLVRYGDQYETLSFGELIEVHAGDTEIDVKLRNLEYDLTRTIKRVSQDFESMESIFAKLPSEMKMTAFLTPTTLPQDFAEVPGHLETVGKELAAASNGRFTFEVVDPSANQALQVELAEKYAIRPLAVDLFGRTTFYLDVLLEMGGEAERVLPRSALSEADVREALEAAVKRMTPGQLTRVGLLTEVPEAPPPNPQLPPQMQPPPPQPDFRAIEQLMSEDYEFERLTVENGVIPDKIDVLVVGKPGALSPEETFAVDQFLMRGGKVIAFSSRYGIQTAQTGLQTTQRPGGINALLTTWGVEIGDSIVMDPQNVPFPIPVQERRGPLVFQRIELIDYPFFPDIRPDGFADHPALAGVNNVTAPWASPLTPIEVEGLTFAPLLTTTSGTWLNTTGDIQPDFAAHPDKGFAPTGTPAAQVVAATVSGTFPSYYADKPSPLFQGAGGDGADGTGRTMKSSLPDAKLVVLGSSEMVSDLMVQISQQGGEAHRSNLQLLLNLVDWSTEDTDLLQIRSSGDFARTLRPLDESEAQMWEVANWGFGAVLLFVVVGIPQFTRRKTPIDLKGVTR